MTIIDLAKSLKSGGTRTRTAYTSSTAAGGGYVRYGTATAVDGSSVTCKLDGSDTSVTLTADAAVQVGERVRVVSQGGSYAVVALKGVATAAADASAAREQAGEAAAKADAVESAVDAVKGDVSAVKDTVKGVADDLDGFKSTVASTYTTAKDFGDYQATVASTYSTVSHTSEAVEAAFGQSVRAVKTEYAVGTSPTTAPTSGWSTSTPSWSSGKYVWQRTVTTKGDGSTVVGNATCIQGAAGAKGADGDAGKGIKAATPQYYLSKSPTSVTGGSWAVAPQGYVEGRYYWTRTQYTWDDGSAATYSTPVYDPSLTEALSGVATLETLIRATKDGLEVAKLVDGEYIGPQTQLDNEKLAIVQTTKGTDGTETVVELARFAANEVRLAESDSHATISMAKGTGTFTGSTETWHFDPATGETKDITVNSMQLSSGRVTIKPDACFGAFVSGGEIASGKQYAHAETTLGYQTEATMGDMAFTVNVSTLDGTGGTVVSRSGHITCTPNQASIAGGGEGMSFLKHTNYNNTKPADASYADLTVTQDYTYVDRGKEVTVTFAQTYASYPGTKDYSPTAWASRCGGLVIVYLNNWASPSAFGGANVTVGTLPFGWRPPAMVKGVLYGGGAGNCYECDNAMVDWALMLNVTAEGLVRVYYPDGLYKFPAGRQISGYVPFFASN